MDSTAAGHRADLIDALRGFALLGIAVVNFVGFAGWPEPDAASRLDDAAALAVVALGEGKFYSLFSLLFGAGYALQLGRGTSSQLYARRLAVLAVFGVVHLVAWPGDILLLYALLGFALLPLSGIGDRSLLITAAVLWLAPIAWHGMAVVTAGTFHPGASLAAAAAGADNTLTSHALERAAHLARTGRPAQVLAMFVVGYVGARRLIHVRVDDHRPLLRRLVAVGLLAGLPTSVMFAVIRYQVRPDYLTPAALVESAVYAVSVATLSLAYVSAFALLWRYRAARSRLRPLASAGRAALTNYLMQTGLALLLFYGIGGIGLGLAGEVGVATVVALALAVFVGQVTASRLWLRVHRHGPAEWVWRAISHGSLQPARNV